MKVITEDPREVIPPIREKMIKDHLILLYVSGDINSYLYMIQPVGNCLYWQGGCIRFDNINLWIASCSKHLIDLIIFPYNLLANDETVWSIKIYLLNKSQELDEVLRTSKISEYDELAIMCRNRLQELLHEST
jgi:hypothetical protein